MPRRLRVSSRVAWAALLLCGAVCARAATGAGTQSAEFLRIGVGPRAVALGEAYTGLADGALSLAYNPAGPAFLRRTELNLAHDEYAAGLRHEWAAVSVPTPWGAFSAGANLLLVEAFESYDSFDRPSGETSASDGAYLLGYAAPLTPTLAVGGSAEFVSSRLHETTGRTVAGNAGVLWRPVPSLSLGAAVLHLGPGLRYVSETADLPMTVRGGLAWTPFDPKDFPHYFTATVDGVKVRGDSAAVRGGLELWYDRVLALRAGGRSDSEVGPGYSLGMGARVISRDSFEMDFDYAFTDSGRFAETHRVGVSLRFGEAITDNAWSRVFQRNRVYREDAPRPRRARGQRPEPRPQAPASSPTEFDNWIRP